MGDVWEGHIGKMTEETILKDFSKVTAPDKRRTRMLFNAGGTLPQVERVEEPQTSVPAVKRVVKKNKNMEAKTKHLVHKFEKKDRLAAELPMSEELMRKSSGKDVKVNGSGEAPTKEVDEPLEEITYRVDKVLKPANDDKGKSDKSAKKSENRSSSGKYEKMEKREKSTKSEERERSGKSEERERSGRSEKRERSKKSGGSDKVDRSVKSEGRERSEKREHRDKNERLARQLVKLISWDDHFQRWVCSPNEESLGETTQRAMRFQTSTQFLQAFYTGKVAIGQNRPRRLKDLEREYGPEVIEHVKKLLEKEQRKLVQSQSRKLQAFFKDDDIIEKVSRSTQINLHLLCPTLYHSIYITFLHVPTSCDCRAPKN